MPDIGVLICGHGSRDPKGAREFAVLADRIAGRFRHWTFAHGFLEFAEPTIEDGLKRLMDAGAKTVIAVPALLFAAKHAKQDIPALLRTHLPPGIELRYAEPLGFDPRMLRAAADRIEEAEAGTTNVARGDSLLLVSGRGTTDADANHDLVRFSQMLSAGMEFGRSETCYAGIAEPQTATALDRAVKLGYRRIVVMPYFLFNGTLVERVHTAADEAVRRHPSVEIVKASYLNDHPLIVETFSERIIAALEGPEQEHDHHHHDHAHDHDDDDEWHVHAPGGSYYLDDVFSLAPRKRAGAR